MKYSNHLESHHPESNSKQVNKIGNNHVKNEIQQYKIGKIYKRFYNKKRRMLIKNPKNWFKF